MALVGDNPENGPAQGQAAPRHCCPCPACGDTWLTLFLISSGPLGKAPDGKDAQDGLTRRLVRPRGARRGPGQRPGGWRRYRRPRPRLSHKGPMPF
ncbi:apelin [Molothrus aeneus]|uniref:apelin n=2 Tax=Icteridae TaxID=164646 RepID=UPI0023E75DB2|nr:apelin [Molothrus ater]XP_054497088.1 apelin [Agelaius phoeniceus]